MIQSWMLDGETDTAVAAKLANTKHAVSRQAVTSFRHRYADKLGRMNEEAEARALDPAITRKAERLAAKNERWLGLRSVIAERGADESMAAVPGGQTGLMVRQYKMLGGGEYAQVVEEYKVDTGLLEAANELERSAAAELGQLPRPEVNIQQNLVFIREYITDGHGESIPLG